MIMKKINSCLFVLLRCTWKIGGTVNRSFGLAKLKQFRKYDDNVVFFLYAPMIHFICFLSAFHRQKVDSMIPLNLTVGRWRGSRYYIVSLCIKFINVSKTQSAVIGIMQPIVVVSCNRSSCTWAKYKPIVCVVNQVSSLTIIWGNGTSQVMIILPLNCWSICSLHGAKSIGKELQQLNCVS